MESLLLVANHPDIKLREFMDGVLGIRHPVNRIAEEALRTYLYLNLLVVLREQGSEVCDPVKTETGEEVPGRRVYMDLQSYRYMLSTVTGRYDDDAQNLVHCEFFHTRGVDEAGDLEWKEGSKDVLADMEALKEYLKGLAGLVCLVAGGLEELCKTSLARSFG
ncbi:hypothetical protein PG991_007093 [Apiospora marii]|uniref:Uncharacterized protein n=1 Tax=Apiospora marii TaxID=335849 RepID=A0ABR1RSL1_9PEZI